MDTLDPTLQAQAAAYRHLFLTLRAAIPPADDSPQAAYQRDQAAIAQVAGLCPANLAEATLAAQYAAANAAALDCLTASRQAGITPADADRLLLRANTMMRRAEGALTNLTRMQAFRLKRDLGAEAASYAAWAEHAVTTWMGSSQEQESNPEIRNHETNPEQSAPDAAVITVGTDDESLTTRHNPNESNHETDLIPPEPDPPSGSDDEPKSQRLTHYPVIRCHETYPGTAMTTGWPPAGAGPTVAKWSSQE